MKVINAEGLQQENIQENVWHNRPVELVKDEKGQVVKGMITLDEEDVAFQLWLVKVGRIKIYLLDSNLEENSQQARDITRQLYDSDRDVRIRQEILLGIGGIQALDLLALDPDVYHVNEGHSAFLLLERLAKLIDEGLSYEEAREVVWASTVFTTHTPVPAGNERFNVGLIQRYLSDYAEKLSLSWDEFIGLGRENPADPYEEYCMTILALNFSAFANGVSKLHGEVSRHMWQKLFQGIPVNEVPIGHVTNGVHGSTWLHPKLSWRMSESLEEETVKEELDFNIWDAIYKLSDKEVWDDHCRERKELILFARRQLRNQRERLGASAADLSESSHLFNPNALTIGFARRFATYKRGYLFLSNRERLKNILCNPERPVQILLAGKAHPADMGGKEIIQAIYEMSREPEFKNHIIFLEDYNIDIGRRLVQGVDIWLNNPRRPMEASGTSGMKAAMNGGLNLSIMDGWWDEGYTKDVGWSIGQGESFKDYNIQDRVESELLYGALEHEIIPTFYDRDEKGIPHEWVRMMKESISKLGKEFSSHRMLVDYVNHFYQPALKFQEKLCSDNKNGAKELAIWRHKIAANWADVEIVDMSAPQDEAIYKGHELTIKARVKLGKIKPENLLIECYYGPLDAHFNINKARRQRMEPGETRDGITEFSTTVKCSRGGHFGYTIRVLPGHHLLANEFLPGLMKWLEHE